MRISCEWSYMDRVLNVIARVTKLAGDNADLAERRH